MRNTLTTGLRGSLVLLLVTVAFVFVLGLYKTVVREQVERDTINITQANYDQAKAKWEALKIGTYEITSSDPRVVASLRVNRTTGDIYLLALKVEGRPWALADTGSPLTGVTETVYKEYTVEAIYQTIKSALDGVSAAAPAQDKSGTTNFHDFEVRFDPSYGYPADFTEYERTTPDSGEITWRSQVNRIEVRDFSVLP